MESSLCSGKGRTKDVYLIKRIKIGGGKEKELKER